MPRNTTHTVFGGGGGQGNDHRRRATVAMGGPRRRQGERWRRQQRRTDPTMAQRAGWTACYVSDVGEELQNFTKAPGFVKFAERLVNPLNLFLL